MAAFRTGKASMKAAHQSSGLDPELRAELDLLQIMARGHTGWPRAGQEFALHAMQSALADRAFWQNYQQAALPGRPRPVLANAVSVPSAPATCEPTDRSRRHTLFRLRGARLCALGRGFMPAAQPVMRSDASDTMEIVYSDIVAGGQACVLLELANNQQSTRLRLEPGRKNEEAVQISLYKGDNLFEKLQLQTRVSWDLDGFAPGLYRLDMGASQSFQFSIQE